jgi:hypothetical protein
MKHGMKFSDNSQLLDIKTGKADRVHSAPPISQYHGFPRWLIQRIKEKIPKTELAPHPSRSDCELWFQYQSSSGGWLDHFGISTEQGKEVFVSEPYALRGAESMRSIITLAEKLEIRFEVVGWSAHYPMRTLRIIFFPPELPNG